MMHRGKFSIKLIGQEYNHHMIPKIIHYCWFGRGPMPASAYKCIDSWKKFLSNYEIKLWNEDNFDINTIPYTREAYAAKKYAFVSDFARFWILHKYGGLYFDTDVEVIRPLDDIIERGPFMGCEKDGLTSLRGDHTSCRVAPGLGLGVNPGLGLYKEIIDLYSSLHFDISYRNGLPPKTVVDYTTMVLSRHGLKPTNDIQFCAGIWIYPKEYFAPKDVDTHLLEITDNTRTIHHYDASWAEWYDKASGTRGIKLRKMFGRRVGNFINVIIYVLQKDGLSGLAKKSIHKIAKSLGLS